MAWRRGRLAALAAVASSAAATLGRNVADEASALDRILPKSAWAQLASIDQEVDSALNNAGFEVDAQADAQVQAQIEMQAEGQASDQGGVQADSVADAQVGSAVLVDDVLEKPYHPLGASGRWRGHWAQRPVPAHQLSSRFRAPPRYVRRYSSQPWRRFARPPPSSLSGGGAPTFDGDQVEPFGDGEVSVPDDSDDTLEEAMSAILDAGSQAKGKGGEHKFSLDDLDEDDTSDTDRISDDEDSMDGSKRQLMDELHNEASTVNDLSGRVRTLKKQLRDAASESRKLKQQLAKTKPDGKQALMNRLRRAREEARKLKATLSSAKQNSRREVAREKAKETAATAQARQLAEKVRREERELDALRQKDKALANETGALRSEIQNQDVKYAAETKRLQEMRDMLGNVTQAQTVDAKAMAKTQAELAGLHATRAHLEKAELDVQKLNKTTNTLLHEHMRLVREHLAAKSSLADAQKRLNATRSELAKERERRSDLQKQWSETKAKLAEAAAQAREVNDSNTKLAVMEAADKAALDATQSKLQDVDQEFQATKTEVAELRAEKARVMEERMAEKRSQEAAIKEIASQSANVTTSLKRYQAEITANAVMLNSDKIKIQEQEHEVVVLKDKMQKEEQELNRSTHLLKDKTGEIVELHAYMSDSKRKLTGAQEHILELNKELEVLKKGAGAMADAAKASKEQSSKQQQELQDAETALQNTEAEEKQLQRESSKLVTENEDLRKRRAKEVTELNREIAEKNDMYNELNAKVAAQNQTIAAVGQNLTADADKIDKLRQQEAGMNATRSKLATDEKLVAALRADVRLKDKELHDVQARVENVTDDMHKMQAKVADLEAKGAEADNVSKRLQVANVEIETLKSNITNMSGSLGSEHTKRMREEADLNETIDRERKAYAKAQADIAELKSKNQQLERQATNVSDDHTDPNLGDKVPSGAQLSLRGSRPKEAAVAAAARQVQNASQSGSGAPAAASAAAAVPGKAPDDEDDDTVSELAAAEAAARREAGGGDKPRGAPSDDKSAGGDDVMGAAAAPSRGDSIAADEAAAREAEATAAAAEADAVAGPDDTASA